MTDELDLTARITEPSPPSDPMYTVQHAADQAAIAILLAVADVARGPVSVDDLSRLAACCRSITGEHERDSTNAPHDEPMIAPVYSLVSVDAELFDAYLAATGKRLSRLNDEVRLTTIQELGTLASSAPKLRAELEAANAEVQELRVAAGQMDLAHINQGKQLAGAQHALRLANTQLEVANANLLAALRLQQDAPNAKTLVSGLVDLVAYWRKGGSPYDDAANAVEKLLGETFADTLDQVRRERTETNELGAIVAATTTAKGEHVHQRK